MLAVSELAILTVGEDVTSPVSSGSSYTHTRKHTPRELKSFNPQPSGLQVN